VDHRSIDPRHTSIEPVDQHPSQLGIPISSDERHEVIGLRSHRRDHPHQTSSGDMHGDRFEPLAGFEVGAEIVELDSGTEPEHFGSSDSFNTIRKVEDAIDANLAGRTELHRSEPWRQCLETGDNSFHKQNCRGDTGQSTASDEQSEDDNGKESEQPRGMSTEFKPQNVVLLDPGPIVQNLSDPGEASA